MSFSSNRRYIFQVQLFRSVYLVFFLSSICSISDTINTALVSYNLSYFYMDKINPHYICTPFYYSVHALFNLLLITCPPLYNYVLELLYRSIYELLLLFNFYKDPLIVHTCTLTFVFLKFHV